MINSLRLRVQNAQSKMILLLVAGLAIGTHGAAESPRSFGEPTPTGEPYNPGPTGEKFTCDLLITAIANDDRDLKTTKKPGTATYPTVTVTFTGFGETMESDIEMVDGIPRTFQTNSSTHWVGPSMMSLKAGAPTDHYRFIVTAFQNDTGDKKLLSLVATPEDIEAILKRLDRRTRKSDGRNHTQFNAGVLQNRAKAHTDYCAPYKQWKEDEEIEQMRERGAKRWTDGFWIQVQFEGCVEQPCEGQLEIDYLPEGTFPQLPGAVFVLRDAIQTEKQNEFMFPASAKWTLNGTGNVHTIEAVDLRDNEGWYGKEVTLMFKTSPETTQEMRSAHEEATELQLTPTQRKERKKLKQKLAKEQKKKQKKEQKLARKLMKEKLKKRRLLQLAGSTETEL